MSLPSVARVAGPGGSGYDRAPEHWMTMNFRLSDERFAFQDVTRGFAREILPPDAAICAKAATRSLRLIIARKLLGSMG